VRHGNARRLHKLQQKHELRQKLVERAHAAADEEVAWDDDAGATSPRAATPREVAPALGRTKSPAQVMCCGSVQVL
jgi:hypothetical protein